MNCEEFRSLYNGWLDTRRSSPLPHEAVLHRRSCSACGMYARAMLQVDAGLQNIPDVPVPEALLAFSDRPGVRTPARREELSSLLGRGAAFALPALAAWSVSLFIPPLWQFAAQFLLVSGTVVLFAVTSLSPRFIDRSV